MIAAGPFPTFPGAAKRKPFPQAPGAQPDPLLAKFQGAAGSYKGGNTGPVGPTVPTQRTTTGFPPVGNPGPAKPAAPLYSSRFQTRTGAGFVPTVQGGPGSGNSGGFDLPDYDESKLKPLWSEGDINRTANSQINQLTAGSDDALRDLEMRLAGTGAIGSLAEKAGEIRAGTGAAAAGIRGDVKQQATQANAQHKLDQIDRMLTRRGQDIDLSTEEGRQKLQRYLGDLSAATTGRGQDMDWLSAQLDALVSNRGLDVTQRDQDLRYLLGTRDQDVRQRGDDIAQQTAGRGQDVDQQRNTLQAIAAALGIDADLRGQDIQAQIQTLRNALEDARYQQSYQLDRANFGLNAAGNSGGRIY